MLEAVEQRRQAATVSQVYGSSPMLMISADDYDWLIERAHRARRADAVKAIRGGSDVLDGLLDELREVRTLLVAEQMKRREQGETLTQLNNRLQRLEAAEHRRAPAPGAPWVAPWQSPPQPLPTTICEVGR